jgi:hypothetical protein
VRRISSFLICVGSVALIGIGRALGGGAFQYQSPLPGARYVRRETNIIIRSGGVVDRSSIASPELFDVEGSESGRHAGNAELSDDERTVIFSPNAPFSSGETVSVQFAHAIRLDDGEVFVPPAFSFSIAPSMPPQRPLNERSPGEIFGLPSQTVNSSPTGQFEKIARPDSIPLDFPYVSTTLYGSPAFGRLFLASVRFTGSYVPYLMILDDTGKPIFYRKMQGWCSDFKLQPNGLLTYFDTFRGRFYAMDSTYAVIDSFYCGNGYSTDLHELRILPNGHALLLGDDPEPVDMSLVVPGGNRAAVVTGIVLQELDRNKNVVFEWRSWDHFQITDATHEDLTAATIDYVHSNAIELDVDGNILLSSRHMDEISKINRATGETIWRMGGAHNQFTFVNDSIAFSHQHAIRRLENGDITLFDNGNFHNPPFSRAVEYRLDEVSKTATLVWQYRNSPDTYGLAMGYVQRLPGGHTVIGWGAANPSVTELGPDGSKVYELTFEDGVYSYRAYRFEWKQDTTGSVPPIPTAVSLSQNYPNPFNGLTTVLLQLSEPTEVTLKVFDVLGREVKTVLEGAQRAPGDYHATLDMQNMPSGVYFYRLSTRTTSITRRMVLIR